MKLRYLKSELMMLELYAMLETSLKVYCNLSSQCQNLVAKVPKMVLTWRVGK